MLNSNDNWLKSAQGRLAEQLDFWKNMEATSGAIGNPERARLAAVQADGITFQEQLITQRK